MKKRELVTRLREMYRRGFTGQGAPAEKIPEYQRAWKIGNADARNRRPLNSRSVDYLAGES